jgi:hypothetical protein
MENSVSALIASCIVDYNDALKDSELREIWLKKWQGQAILVSS